MVSLSLREPSGWRNLTILGGMLAGLATLAMSRGATEARPADLAQWQQILERSARSAEAPRGSAPLEPAADMAPEKQAAPEKPLDGPRREALAKQALDYDARRAKTVVELQKFRHTETIEIDDGAGRRGRAILVDLNPRLRSWYLLQLTWEGAETASYHLVNLEPKTRRLALDAAFAGGLLVKDADGGGKTERCALWSAAEPASLEAAGKLNAPHVPLCGSHLALRRPVNGRRTSIEWAADFLRDNMPAGEKLTVLVRDNLYKDSELAQGELTAGNGEAAKTAVQPGAPLAAKIAAGHEGDLLEPVDLGLPLAVAPRSEDKLRLPVGGWTAVRDNPGVFVSALEPGLAAELPVRRGRRPNRLDEVENKALTLLVAFDLSRFDLGFAVGTDHPRVGWSERVQDALRDDQLPGPDGIGDIAPLVPGGMVPAGVADRTAATFTAGFKRSHGAFKSGPLAGRNFGSHYGFVESGVVLSKLQPGISTLYVLDDGTVGMKTWSKNDEALLERIAFARQNGVPIVERDPASGEPMPGELVNRWADGNWSGSQDKKLRSVRAGVCLQESKAGRFLLYGYFSSATPAAMARVFQAYGCSYAMITDMNALEHTYLALYRVEGSKLAVDHLVEGMSVLDQEANGQTLPRFLGFADNRDFFYLVRRAPETQKAATPKAAPQVVENGK
jgi:hypothetical protein